MLQIRIYPHKPCALEYECPTIYEMDKPHFTKDDLKIAMQEIDFFRMMGKGSHAEFIRNNKMVMHLEAYSYPDEETGKFKRTNWYLGKTYFGDHAVIRKWGVRMKVKDVISAIGSDKVPVRIFHRDGRITKGFWFQDYILKYMESNVHYFSTAKNSINIYLM